MSDSAGKKPLLKTYKLVLIAILTAMATVLYMPALQIPVVAFYKLDFSNFVILLGGFALGPVEALIMLLLKDIISLFWSSTMGIGELADLIIGAALILPATIMYHRNKTRKTAVIGMLAGTLCMVVGGVLANKWVMIPLFIQFIPFVKSMDDILKMANVDSEWKLLLMATAPFNLLKGVVLCIITGLIYKPLSPVLHGKGIRR